MARVLVVDDEPGIRQAIRRVLESVGHEVIEAEDGSIGARLAEETRPDLVLVDMFMPVKDGFETLRDIRARCSEVKVIAMSGGGRYRLDVLGGLESLGASATLAKPFDREQLLGTVARVLEP
jgi:DNA-binding response OmpR family regulator